MNKLEIDEKVETKYFGKALVISKYNKETKSIKLQLLRECWNDLILDFKKEQL